MVNLNKVEELKSLEGMSIDTLLEVGFKNGASDVHLSCGAQPMFRVDGDILPLKGFQPVTDAWLKREIEKIAPETTWEEFQRTKEADFSHSIEGLSRFRVNTFIQRGTIASVMRTIPSEIQPLSALGMPAVLGEVIKEPRGLVLVTGPTGSGKSTTLAAMIDQLNATQRVHIVTIEDPIEFVHTNKNSLVNQREVGTDTHGFSEALKRVLRQDPDVILVGELRDPETISTALTAAETGHLVFGTLHTQSAEKTIDRIIDSFEPIQQGQVRAQLSSTLRAVVAQTLMKKIGGGRVAATEIMLNNSAVANNIREGNTPQLFNAIISGRQQGMHTLDDSLKNLVQSGIITKESAYPLMRSPRELDRIMIADIDKNSEWGD